jgi:hypothetical protein
MPSRNTYTVYVDVNFHYMDPEERYNLGDFATLATGQFHHAGRLACSQLLF